MNTQPITLAGQSSPFRRCIEPEKVVDAIYHVAIAPEDEVMVGTMGKVTKLLGKVAPKKVEQMMARNTHQAQMEQREREADSEGNVFQPISSGREMHGGLNKGSKVGKLGLVAGVTLGAVGFLLTQRRRSSAAGSSRAA